MMPTCLREREEKTDDKTENSPNDDLERCVTNEFVEKRDVVLDSFEKVVEELGLETDSLTDTGCVVHDDHRKNGRNRERT